MGEKLGFYESEFLSYITMSEYIASCISLHISHTKCIVGVILYK